MGKTNKQYGLWPSTITPDLLATARRLSDFNFGADERVFWLEGRSDRSQVCYTDWSRPDAARELSPAFGCKAKLGYGGGDFATWKDTVFFCERSSGRLYRQATGDMNPVALTPRFGAIASPVVSPDGRFVAYVHQDEDDIDRIAVVDAEGKFWPQILESGADFYTQLRFSPDGQSFAFVSWCHPHMPWESSALFVGKLAYADDGLPRLQQVRKVAGGPGKAVFQPEFSPDSKSLLYVSDESGFGHLYQQDLETGKLRALTSGEEFELGMPNWLQDMRTYCLAEGGRTIVTAVNRQGCIRMHAIDFETRRMELISELADYTEVNRVVASADGTRVLIGASAADKPSVVVGLDLRTRQTRVFARSVDIRIPPEDLAKPQAVTWRTDKLETCHGLFYQPASSRYTCNSGKPPLIALIHGGPTAQATAKFNLEIQYFTSRGYAVLAVNYRGSTGYGRAYMEKLSGQWGVADVNDAVFGLRHFADAGVIDGKRSVIMGGSAGGYTVLQTMVVEPEAFAAGVSLYGIANQFALSKDTHKFEAHYNDSLLGPLPEAAAIYRERSPEFHAAKIRRPLAVFQGDQDKVVPKSQAEAIVKGLAKGGVPHIYHVYEGEGHGFRKSETIRHLYTASDQFIQDYVLFR